MTAITLILGVICAVIIGIIIFCGSHAFNWLYKYSRYFSWYMASGFSAWCFLIQIAMIVYIIWSLIADETDYTLIALGFEAILLIATIVIVLRIKKKQPPEGTFKIVMYMLGAGFGTAWLSFKKVVFKAADVAKELEALRFERYTALERALILRHIEYSKIAHNGWTYYDRNGDEHKVEFVTNDTIGEIY